ncbi:YvaD family protein [Bacillus gobiensis]|uniref:YvaD family protein n=1 Tax=Bacillus gobiensis TaxID=1441095 RepID=UPI003D227B09
MERLKYFFLVTDIGFLLYWTITFFGWIPEEYLFKDYHNPILVSWNWSFLPLDLLVSATGFLSLYFYARKNALWRSCALISLVLTFCAGLHAIAFWTIRLDFDWSWWLVNLYLLVYPCFFIKSVMVKRTNGMDASTLKL